MTRILIVEKSPFVATDIHETVETEFPGLDAVTVGSIEAAEEVLSKPDHIELCIVSGTTTRERMMRLARALDERGVGSVTISDEEVESSIFPQPSVHITRPFTSDMLIAALRQVSSDDRMRGRRSIR
ncbi:hypothetical protein [Palleronia sp. LCG004]|uniref:hypothetical protein n=1 Tax=Palleronia sp. LCG004 TaxID=3079304 RepID=UPI0029430292|nr:hypothetical protein [Palleronia sp. LCG004]WOI56016.1 hypothetical protein RVY76_13390 [Palleronia sp. LCG004]